MEVLGERGVAEELGLLVLGVVREGEGVVGRGAAEEDEGGVAQVLADLGGRGRGGGGAGGGGVGAEGAGDGGGGREDYEVAVAGAEGVEGASERE